MRIRPNAFANNRLRRGVLVWTAVGVLWALFAVVAFYYAWNRMGISRSFTAVTGSPSSGGTSPAGHSVDLRWEHPGTSAIGYNIYRGIQPGGPYIKINLALDPAPNFTDTGVQAGQTYYYVTTSVDGNGRESKYSSEVQATIPAP
jgi:fibronectin type 3 domain-containing protein